MIAAIVVFDSSCSVAAAVAIVSFVDIALLIQGCSEGELHAVPIQEEEESTFALYSSCLRNCI